VLTTSTSVNHCCSRTSSRRYREVTSEEEIAELEIVYEMELVYEMAQVESGGVTGRRSPDSL
jgi:hypothetical protein